MFRRITIEGPPRERGRQYGAQARDLIDQSIELYRDVFAHRPGWQWSQVRAAAAAFIAPIADFSASCMAELEGLAEGSRHDLLDIVALNCRSEMMFHAAECTTVAVIPPQSGREHILIGQNWDWLAGASATTVIVEAQCEGEPNFVAVVEAGLLAKTGMNSAGLGLVTNALVAQAPGPLGSGVPYHVLLRSLLSRTTAKDCVDVIHGTARAASGNFMIADAAAMVINLETAPGGADAVYVQVPEDGLLAHTNHFTSESFRGTDLLVAEMPDSPFRLARLKDIARGRPDRLGLDFLQDVFADHDGYPTSLCAHVPADVTAPAERWTTVASVILSPATRQLWLAAGTPCTEPYELLCYADLLSDAT